jgi:hypothetical protein
MISINKLSQTGNRISVAHAVSTNSIANPECRLTNFQAGSLTNDQYYFLNYFYCLTPLKNTPSLKVMFGRTKIGDQKPEGGWTNDYL